MKKILIWLMVMIFAGIGAAAQPEEKCFTLSEYMGIKDGTEYVKQVQFLIPEVGNSQKIDVQPDKFLALADSIVLTDVENEPMYKSEDGSPHTQIDFDGIYIDVLLDESKTGVEEGDFGSVSFVYVSQSGKVDKYSLSMSRLPTTDCVMSLGDADKLFMLYNESLADSEEEALTPPVEEKEEYNPISLAIVVVIICAVVALTMWIISLTKKK